MKFESFVLQHNFIVKFLILLEAIYCLMISIYDVGG